MARVEADVAACGFAGLEGFDLGGGGLDGGDDVRDGGGEGGGGGVFVGLGGEGGEGCGGGFCGVGGLVFVDGKEGRCGGK